ncbi:hypothetical protein [Natrinema amylolyticum]|uniref:hypothetical protein n=1 Tax=Natrinema amylolyticum TaxID=2878679 RepID=UPI001CFB1232|nr:hypothetical protein [Natrinema amylolyticum]
MTETSTRTQTDAETDRPDRGTETDPTSEPADTTGFDPGSDRIRRSLAWGGLAVCSLLAVFALIQFYGSVADAIDLWVDPKYQPLIRAAFNLAVLLTSLIGVSLLVRELSDGDD